MLINKETQARVWEHELKAQYPNTSFPETLKDSDVEPFGYAVLNYGEQPVVPVGHLLVDSGVEVIDGSYFVKWEPIPKTPEELLAELDQWRQGMTVSPRQIRQALTRAGLREQVEGAVASGTQDTKDWWEFATEFHRMNTEVVGMGSALGLAPEDVDSLFALAATL